MGKDLYESSPAAAAVYDAADRLLDWSIKDICFEGPAERLTESRHCQPAIFVTSLACLAAFQEKHPELEPCATAGLSLGEFAALKLAGVLDFESGLRLVLRRGELMDEACAATGGAMASVLGGEPEAIAAVCAEQGVDVANYNCPGQIVISGAAEAVGKAVEALKERGFRKIIPLKVAGAYHSRLMKTAEDRLAPFLAEIQFNVPAIPLAQNFSGALVSTVAELRANTLSQVSGSVRWDDCVRALVAVGADTFIEFGPGAVLTGLVKRTCPEVKLFNVNGAASLAGFTA